MILKNLKKKFLINSFLVLLIFLLDIISKIYVIYIDKQFLGSEIFSSKYLNINLIWNDGIAFGLLSFEDKTIYNYITILISSVVIILLFLISRTKKFKKFSYIIITGGALGNLFDRIIYNSVPDFIDLHYNGFHWFVFNVADIFITIGIICLIYDEIFLGKKTNE